MILNPKRELLPQPNEQCICTQYVHMVQFHPTGHKTPELLSYLATELLSAPLCHFITVNICIKMSVYISRFMLFFIYLYISFYYYIYICFIIILIIMYSIVVYNFSIFVFLLVYLYILCFLILFLLYCTVGGAHKPSWQTILNLGPIALWSSRKPPGKAICCNLMNEEKVLIKGTIEGIST